MIGGVFKDNRFDILVCIFDARDFKRKEGNLLEASGLLGPRDLGGFAVLGKNNLKEEVV